MPLHTDHATMEWALVVLERRHWTSISVAVMAAFAWVLFVLGGTETTSPLWWASATVTLTSGGVWVSTYRELTQTQRRLRRSRILEAPG